MVQAQPSHITWYPRQTPHAACFTVPSWSSTVSLPIIHGPLCHYVSPIYFQIRSDHLDQTVANSSESPYTYVMSLKFAFTPQMRSPAQSHNHQSTPLKKHTVANIKNRTLWARRNPNKNIPDPSTPVANHPWMARPFTRIKNHPGILWNLILWVRSSSMQKTCKELQGNLSKKNSHLDDNGSLSFIAEQSAKYLSNILRHYRLLIY